jgi:transketolase
LMVRADARRQAPVCIIARTIKGKGIAYMEREPGWHLGYLAPEDQARAIAELKGEPG